VVQAVSGESKEVEVQGHILTSDQRGPRHDAILTPEHRPYDTLIRARLKNEEAYTDLLLRLDRFNSLLCCGWSGDRGTTRWKCALDMGEFEGALRVQCPTGFLGNTATRRRVFRIREMRP